MVVLILIFLEDALRVFERLVEVTSTKVLILIFLEDALRVLHAYPNKIGRSVLILIFLEDALREPPTSSTNNSINSLNPYFF